MPTKQQTPNAFSLLRERDERMAASNHLHDFAMTISAGDLDPLQLVTLRATLEVEVADLVKRVNAKTAALTGAEVHGYVSFDGRRECGEH